MVRPLVTNLTLSVSVAVWIRETGSGPPTHVRDKSDPAASRATPKVLASPARLGRARLVAPHTEASLAHWDPSRAGLASQTRTCMCTLSDTGTACQSVYTSWVKLLLGQTIRFLFQLFGTSSVCRREAVSLTRGRVSFFSSLYLSHSQYIVSYKFHLSL
jgi:hypothetical protein